MNSDDIGKGLSEKLLQGWCMLNKNCEECYTPVMRNKQGREFCCGCNKFLDEIVKQADSIINNYVVVEESKGEMTTNINEAVKSSKTSESSVPVYQNSLEIQSVKASIIRKMVQLAKALEGKSDLGEIHKILELISLSETIIRQLN